VVLLVTERAQASFGKRFRLSWFVTFEKTVGLHTSEVSDYGVEQTLFISKNMIKELT
jgi:hypothetical protein